MNRTALNRQDVSATLTFDERPGITYRITDCVGRGASCIVYRATASDNTEHLLKEYFPKHLSLHRDTFGYLHVPTEQQQDFNEGLTRFRNSCQLQNTIRLSFDKLKNYTGNIQGYYCANGTAYMDMTCFSGQTYDQLQEKSVYALLLRMRTLTQVIGNYHEAGLLHLDIKPENIYVRPEGETVEDVMLFDFDSVTPMSDVRFAKALSCTKTWAAPEQLLPEKRKNICAATDLFAIGEIIFTQLFGRHSTGAERRSFVTQYDYDYEAAIFKDMDPRVFSHLDTLLHRTICGVVEKRYQSAGELIEKLDRILDLADPKAPYLKSNSYALQEHFEGRADEIENIRKHLEENPILFLHGIGGIGKSELAKRFALADKELYDTVIFATCDRDIHHLLLDDTAIPLYHFHPQPDEPPESYCKRKLKELTRLCDRRTLLVIDNVNRSDDPDLKNLLELGATVLITTRADFEDYGIGQQLRIGPLRDRSDVWKIFCRFYKKALSPEEKECIDEIFDLIACHTMTVELLAKQMMAGRIKPEQLLRKLKNTGIRELGKERVSSGKDGALSSQSAYDHIRALFDLSGLDQEEQFVLANLSLIPASGIFAEDFHDWCGLDGYDCINRLVSAGWARLDKEQDLLSLHPVVAEVCFSLAEQHNGYVYALVKNAVYRSTQLRYHNDCVPKFNELSHMFSSFLPRKMFFSIYKYKVCDYLSHNADRLDVFREFNIHDAPIASRDRYSPLLTVKKALETWLSFFADDTTMTADVIHMLGNIHLWKKKFDTETAAAMFQKALDMCLQNKNAPELVYAIYISRHNLFLRTEQRDLALEQLETALQFANTNSAPRMVYANLYKTFSIFHFNDYTDEGYALAEKHILKALEICPKSDPMYKDLLTVASLVYSALNNNEQTAAYLKEALALFSDNADS
ncbi:MAG: hypothetical protein IKU07_01815 [Oscillospiraceae bacterium]|nr:hypothetical protein [Oscillospiraceae bacterium]